MIRSSSVFISLACLLLSSATFAQQPKQSPKVKNIIFMIGDGMGVAQTSAYRYYQDDLTTKTVETTVFDQLLVGSASTYPDDKTIVTDSAASATALSSGIKTYNGAIGFDINKKPVLTLLERARQLGKTTAIVSSSQINHATPASFMVHNESRHNYNEIADAYVDDRINNKVKADLMLGGGTQYFIRDDRNLVNELKAFGYHYVNDLSQLEQLNQLPALGLFAPKGLPFAIDNDQLPNRVTAMTKQALKLLSENSDNGFFAMIEGSQIDWCSHGNDIACTMAEMDDFAQAISLAKEFTENRNDTLLIITADHSTGGLSLGSNKKYEWLSDKVKLINSSLETMLPEFLALNKDASTEQIVSVWNKHIGFKLTEPQITKIKKALGEALKQAMVAKTITKLINDSTLSGWTTGGHTAEDVQVFATGVASERFVGFQNNTDIATKLFSLLEAGN